jgi:hypothetical protein
MFQKLDITLPSIDIKKLQGNKLGGYVGDTIPDFREHVIRDVQYLSNLFEDVIKLTIPPTGANVTVINKDGAIIPHTDVCATALNFYLEVNGSEITTFYDNPSKHKIPQEEVPGLYFYDIDQLQEIGNFTANLYDCYLLDTHVPHAVSNQSNGSRVLLRFVWLDHDFNTILKSIKIL